MKQLIHYQSIFSPVIFILAAGVLGGFMAASGLLVLMLIFSRDTVLESLLVLLIVTFLLGDNFKGTFAFMQNFRFVMVLVSFLYLLKYHVISNNLANYILPFTMVAFCVTMLFSPLGIAAVLRSLGFWLVGLVIFKLANLLYLNNSQRTAEILILTLVCYFAVNIILVFLPLESTSLRGRFKGLAGNPNGLALIAMFSYGLLWLLKEREETAFKKSFFLAFRIVLLLIVLLTGSRTALLSIITFELILRLIHNKVLLFRLMTIVIFFLLFFDVIVNSSFFEAYSFFDFLRFDTLSTASGRTEVWQVAWEEVKNAPFFGNGLLYDQYFIDDYVARNIGENVARHWGAVWSSYLSLLLDVGFMGCIAYGYFWIEVFRKSHDKNIAIAFTAMCLLSGITESWMAASMNPFTPMMFLFWAIQSQPTTNA